MNTTNDNNKILFNYLNSLYKKDLFSLANTSLLFDNYNHYICNISKLNKYKKKNLIDFIITNKKKIIINFLKLTNKDIRNNLKYIIKRINKNNIFKLKKIDNKLIQHLEYNHIGTTSIINNKIVIIIPDEFIILIKKYINNSQIITSNKAYNKLIKCTDMLLNSYGLITLNNYNLFYKFNYLEYYLVCGYVFNKYKITSINNEVIIYRNELDIKYIEEVYSNEYIFKKLSKKKIKNIYNLKFLKKKRYYKKYITYISLHFIIDKKELDSVCSNYILGYLYNNQVDSNKAISIFKEDFKSEFEVSKQELELFIKWFNKVYSKYPKWIKKGNK